MTLRPLALLLPLVGLVIAGCESVAGGPPVARGNTEEILVLTDSATWDGPVGEAIRAELAQPIATLPNQQGAFRLRFQPLNPRFFENVKTLPNLVFAAPLDTPGPVGEFLRARVGEANLEAVRSGRATAFNVREDLWAQDQVVVIATAASDTALAAAFRERGDALRRQFNELARVRTTGEMFSRLRQTDLEADMLERMGARVQVQYDYVLTDDSTLAVAGRTGDFVRYRRVLSDTWRDFFLFAQDGVTTLPSVGELDALTNGLLERFALGNVDSSYVQLDDQRPVASRRVTIGGREALETRGLWYLENGIMGGSYVRYALVDETTDRLYVYYGMTFAPSRTIDKREILRQMEAIGYTLRTRSDLAGAPEA